MAASLPHNESERLAVLREHSILDTPPQEEFDDLVRLAASLCGVPIAAVSLIDEHRQWFKSIVGLPICETARDVAFCAHTVLQTDILVVPDAQTDPRFFENPLVTDDPYVRFYAGVPLITDDGYALGSLCIIDTVPKSLTPEQEAALRLLARQVSSQIKAKRHLAERERLLQEKEQMAAALIESEERLRRLTDAAFEGIAISQNGMIVDASPAFAALFGYDTPAEMIGLAGLELAAPVSREIVAHKIRLCDEEPYEAILMRRDRTTFQAELRGRRVLIGGSPARVAAVRDITERKEMERLLRESQRRLAEAQQIAQIGSWEYDIKTGRITWSEELFRLFDMDPSEGEPPIEGLMLRYHPDDVEMHMAVTNQAMQDGQPYEFDIRIRQQYGSVRWAHAVGRGELDETGNVVRLFGTLMDIHERKLAEERFRVLFDHSPHAHLLFNENGGIIDCNAATLAMMRCGAKAELLGTHPALLSPEFQPDGRRSDEKGAEMCVLAKRNGEHRFEWQRRALDGHEYPVEVTLTPVMLGGNPVLLSVWHDLTEQKHAEAIIKDHAVVLEYQKKQLEEANAELEALATTDGLTGLKNHRAFQERLAEEVSRAARYCTPLALILLDVDNFKQYNDSYGHPEGDAVLRTVARILQHCARDTDLVARYGGEEFVLVLPQTDLEGAAAFAERVRAAIGCHSWNARSVTASFGVTALQPTDEHGAAMITRADKALYQSKSTGRNRVSCGGPITEHPNCPTPVAAADSFDNQNGSAAVFFSDMNGNFLQISSRACSLLGFHEAELIGTSGYDLLHPNDIERQGWRMDDVTAGQVVVTERRVRRKDGSWLQAELRTKQTGAGQVECVMREITRSRKAEETRQEEAARRFKFMQDVLASVTDGRLILCSTEADLPIPLHQSFEPIFLSEDGGLCELRHTAGKACEAAGIPEARTHDLILAAGEAGMNSIVHVGKGISQVSVSPQNGMVQVRITDQGRGISWENLPKATLQNGYSSAGTFGHGMKIMLQTADRIYLLTGPEGTTVVLEQEYIASCRGANLLFTP